MGREVGQGAWVAQGAQVVYSDGLLASNRIQFSEGVHGIGIWVDIFSKTGRMSGIEAREHHGWARRWLPEE